MASEAAGDKVKMQRRQSFVNKAGQEEKEVVTYGDTPEIDAAFNLCVEQIWENQTIEESTGMIRREEIGWFIKNRLADIDEAALSNDDYDKYFK